jgi:hypothetical protein
MKALRNPIEKGGKSEHHLLGEQEKANETQRILLAVARAGLCRRRM